MTYEVDSNDLRTSSSASSLFFFLFIFFIDYISFTACNCKLLCLNHETHDMVAVALAVGAVYIFAAASMFTVVAILLRRRFLHVLVLVSKKGLISLQRF